MLSKLPLEATLQKRPLFKSLQAPTARNSKLVTRCCIFSAAPHQVRSLYYCRLFSKHLRNASNLLSSGEVLDIANVTLRNLRATSLFTSKASAKNSAMASAHGDAPSQPQAPSTISSCPLKLHMRSTLRISSLMQTRYCCSCFGLMAGVANAEGAA